MREDPDRALKVSGMIDAADVRKEAEDDLNLALVQKLLLAGSYDEARKTTRKFDSPELQAKVLTELASKVLSGRNSSLALELLSEASEIASKAEATPDKAITMLGSLSSSAR